MRRKALVVSVGLCMYLGMGIAGADGMTTAPSGAEAVTEISGSLLCPAGQHVRITVWVDSPQVVLGFWPANSPVADDGRFTSSVVTFVTSSQSTSWKVTGSSLSQANDSCS